MDWNFADAMSPKGTSAQDRRGATDKNLRRDEVQKIVSGELAPLRKAVDRLAANQRPASSPSPWRLSIGSAVVGGLLVWAVGALFSHGSQDLKRDVSTEVAAQLRPVQEKIQTMAEDIAKIKGKEGIAQNPAPPSPASLSALQEQVKALASQDRPSESQVVQAASALRAVNPDTPGYWPVAESTINLQARARIGKPLTVIHSMPNCIEIAARDMTSLEIDGGDYSCGVLLDGVKLSNSTIRNAVVSFSGRVRISNVRFINCVFLISLPSAPPTPVKTFVVEILEKNHPRAGFTVTAG